MLDTHITNKRAHPFRPSDTCGGDKGDKGDPDDDANTRMRSVNYHICTICVIHAHTHEFCARGCCVSAPINGTSTNPANMCVYVYV